jgi:hypothetical protein
MDATIPIKVEQAIKAKVVEKLDVDEKHFDKTIKLSVASVKDGGWVVRIKIKPDESDAITRVHPGQTISVNVGQILYVESNKDTKLTIEIPT